MNNKKTPSVDELVSAAQKIVFQAERDGVLGQFTPKNVRRQIEAQFGLSPGTLDAPQYKPVLNEAVKAAAENASQRDIAATTSRKPLKASNSGNKKNTSTVSRAEKDKHENRVVSAPGPTSSAQLKATIKKRKAAVSPSSSDVDEIGTCSSGVGGKPKNKSMKRSNTASGQSADTLDNTHILSKTNKSRKASSSKMAVLSSEDEEADDPPAETAQNSKNRKLNVPTVSDAHKNNQATKGQEMEVDGSDSDSELSVLIDEPPARKRKGKQESKGNEKEKSIKSEKQPKRENDKKKRKGVSEPLSKDEETIKRLKSLVSACGVRKVWSREFAGAEDSPKEQIRRLRNILTSLGMTGRMGLEQAKQIKEKRELAQELEDVQNFAKSIEGSDRRRRGRDAENHSSDRDQQSDSEEGKPAKKSLNARQSIMAFLGDESD